MVEHAGIFFLLGVCFTSDYLFFSSLAATGIQEKYTIHGCFIGFTEMCLGSQGYLLMATTTPMPQEETPKKSPLVNVADCICKLCWWK